MTRFVLVVLALAACKPTPTLSPAPDDGGAGATPTQVVAPKGPPIDGSLVGVWVFTGQIRREGDVPCKRDVECGRESFRFSADGTVDIQSARLDTTSCVWKASNGELTYQCGTDAPITQDYLVSEGMLCVWQSPGFAHCYSQW